MSKRPVVALVATCNRPFLLAQRSLPSLFAQTRKPDVLVVIDDSVEQLRLENQLVIEKQPQEMPVHYLWNPVPKGAAASWNKALRWIQECLGVCWIAILDDDDRWKQNHLELCLQSAERTGATGVLSGIEVITPTQHFCQPLLGSLQLTHFLRGNPGWQGSNTFLHLEHFLTVRGFAEEMPSTLDRDLAIRILLQNEVCWAFTDQHTVEYYIEPELSALSTAGSWSKQDGLARFHQRYRLLMTPEDHQEFCERAERFFGVPPHRFHFPSYTNSSERLAAVHHFLTTVLGHELQLLGFGKEGVVLHDQAQVYKLFDGWYRQPPADLPELVIRNREILHRHSLFPWIPPQAIWESLGPFHLLRYAYEPSRPYLRGYRKQMVQLIRDLRSFNRMYYGFRPSSFRIVEDILRLVDWGGDLKPWVPYRVHHNLQRAYLLIEHGENPHLRQFQEQARQGKPLPQLQGFADFVRECGEEGGAG